MRWSKAKIFLVLTFIFLSLAIIMTPLLLLGTSQVVQQKSTREVILQVNLSGIAEVKESILFESTMVKLNNDTFIPAKLLEQIRIRFGLPQDIRVMKGEIYTTLNVGRFKVDLGKETVNDRRVETAINMSTVKEYIKSIKNEAGISITKYKVVISYTASVVLEGAMLEPLVQKVAARAIIGFDMAENVYQIVLQAPEKKVPVKIGKEPEEQTHIAYLKQFAFPIFLLGVAASPITALVYRREKAKENPLEALTSKYNDIIMLVDDTGLGSKERVYVKNPWRMANLAEKTGNPLLLYKPSEDECAILCVPLESINLCSRLCGSAKEEN